MCLQCFSTAYITSREETTESGSPRSKSTRHEKMNSDHPKRFILVRKNKFAKQTGLLVSAEVPHYNVSILHTVRQIHTSIHLAAILLRGNLTSRQSRTSVAYSVSLCFRTREIAPTFPAQSRTSSDRCEAEKSSELARRRKGRNWLTVSVASSKRRIEKRH